MTMFKTYALSTSILAGLAVGALATPAFADTILTGKITNATNQPLEGVPVSFRQLGSSYTTSVYTDAAGEYVFPAMPVGKYKMWAQAVGFQNHIADVDVKGNVLKQDIKLPARADFEVQMRGDEWLHSMPRETDEDKRMAVVFRMAFPGILALGWPQVSYNPGMLPQRPWALVPARPAGEPGLTIRTIAAEGCDVLAIIDGKSLRSIVTGPIPIIPYSTSWPASSVRITRRVKRSIGKAKPADWS